MWQGASFLPTGGFSFLLESYKERTPQNGGLKLTHTVHTVFAFSP
jgi:hypothetical protein